MATMFGRFEVQSELSKSDTALIYKVMDTETNQVVALKTQSLARLGKRADGFVDTLIREGESSRNLSSPHIVALYGAGEIEGQFCAAMEYIQGNSVASMLSRKEGFSIWDLIDITRQVCAGLEHAAGKNLTHCSLEPAKLMVQWDGTVKILGYGISNMSLIEAEAGNSLGRLMPYCSPEQIRGEAIDLRSNLFTVGAILYEMVGGQKAFDASDPVALLNQIENEMPANPSSVNSKIQPGVSALIMKALAKDPAERYQSARELLDDLEQCKENGKKAASDTTKAASAAGVATNAAARGVSANKFVAPAGAAKSGANAGGGTTGAAAAAAVATRAPSYGIGTKSDPNLDVNLDLKHYSKSGARSVGEFDASSPEYQAARVAAMSAPPLEQEAARQAPRIAVDPLMAKPATSSSGKSFSDLAEMPPLKQPMFDPPAAEAFETPLIEVQTGAGKYSGREEKPRSQSREVAGKALHEIATVPPRLMLFAILGAVGLILVIMIALYFHVRSEDTESTAESRPVGASVARPSPVQRGAERGGPQQAESSPAVSSQVESSPVVSSPVISRPAVLPKVDNPVPAIVEVQPNVQIRAVKKGIFKSARRAPAAAAVPVIVPGEAVIDSNPQGAAFQVDEKSDPSWVTPFTLTGLAPGKHIVAINKAGYSSEIRSIEVTSGAKASLVLHLAPVNALMLVGSTPPGADIVLDGKPTGRVTPSQFAVEKGTHTVLLRKQGYLEEATSAELSPAQNFQYSPQLRALGNTADMRTVGKFSKLFGHGGDSTAGMGAISVRTQPKGAQVAINQSVLEKTSPVDVMLGPGNYVVDITLTGFKPIHKVVGVEKSGKAAIDEVLERQ